ncbi:MAG: hypothetical protein ACXWT3_08090 [Methylococcaceae bacterium]
MNGGECESKTFSDEELENSNALQNLSIRSTTHPINISNPEEVKHALAPSLVWLIDATDNKRIQFQSKADEEAFSQMMLVNFQQITQIRPESSVQH